MESQRQLVADASHELRTPIASLRANIQLLGDADPGRPRLRTRADAGGHRRGAGRADRAGGGDVVELARGAKPPEQSWMTCASTGS